MYIIGLTGGIACGKSSVTTNLRRHFGAVTLDIDKITRQLLQPGGTLFELYIRHFGKQIVTEAGTLNRKLIGEIIFSCPAERDWINSVAHPILLQRARDFLVDCSQAGAGLVVLEVPLLFQAGWEILFDEIWAVCTLQHLQLERLMRRDKLTEEQALARINAQMPVKEICNRADVTIRNVGGYNKIQKKILAALRGRTF